MPRSTKGRDSIQSSIKRPVNLCLEVEGLNRWHNLWDDVHIAFVGGSGDQYNSLTEEPTEHVHSASIPISLNIQLQQGD